ncbi:MAG TPA: hypothetical protein VF285_11280 [Castellaniella sp.]|uniref:hypothetical protein n=1 Tax=Castellaniella sp. TaxID=1955812 RepID=UPI002EE7BC03
MASEMKAGVQLMARIGNSFDQALAAAWLAAPDHDSRVGLEAAFPQIFDSFAETAAMAGYEVQQ